MAKLTPYGLRIVANTHLEGTSLGELIERIQLETDDDGNLTEHAIDSLRKAFRGASAAAPEEYIRNKCVKMVAFLEEADASNSG